jgi:hypothetical protein
MDVLDDFLGCFAHDGTGPGSSLIFRPHDLPRLTPNPANPIHLQQVPPRIVIRDPVFLGAESPVWYRDHVRIPLLRIGSTLIKGSFD